MIGLGKVRLPVMLRHLLMRAVQIRFIAARSIYPDKSLHGLPVSAPTCHELEQQPAEHGPAVEEGRGLLAVNRKR